MKFTLDTDLPVVEREAWDGDAARDRILAWAGYDDAESDEQRETALNRAARLFLFRREESTAKSDLVAPCGDIVDGEPRLVTSGLRYALAAVNGARGGIDAPEQLLARARNAILKLLGEEEPAEKSASEVVFQSDTLTIKRYNDGRIVAKGYAIVWNSTDLDGDSFPPNVDLGEDLLGIKQYPLLYEHGLHPEIGAEIIGRVIKAERDDIGLLIEAELNRHTRYIELVKALAQNNALGLSTGAVAHLVRKENKTIKIWPVVEISLTPTPAEPKTLGVELSEALLRKSAAQPKVNADVAEDKAAETVAHQTQTAETNQQPEVKSMFATEPTNQAFKSFGDFARAVRTGAVKALNVSTGPQGGYLVPEEFIPEILTMATERSIVLQRAFVVNAMGTVRQPVIDLSRFDEDTDTASWFGGVRFEFVAEGETIPETEPRFEQYTLRALALAGTTRISNRLLEMRGFDAFIRQIFTESMAWHVDRWCIRGNGVGKPLGILNAPSTVEVQRASQNDFKPEDAAEMLAHFMPLGGAQPVWMMHRSVLPKLTAFKVGDTPVWQPDYTRNTAGTLFGIPIVFTEHMRPLGTAGDVMLVDWSAYAVQIGEQIEIATSEHAFFVQDQTAYRVMMIFDGQPRIRHTAKIANNYALSPFVKLV